MANTPGTLSSGLILQRALELVVPLRPILGMISLDLSSETAKLGETVKSRIFSIPTVSDFPSASSDFIATDVPVTISNAKQIRHTFTNAELSSTDRNMVDEAARPIALAIAGHMIGALAALYTKTNFPNETVAPEASTGYDDLNAMRSELSGRDVAEAGRFAILNKAAYKAALEDPLCNRAAKNSGEDPIASGHLSGVAGFEKIFEFPGLPSTNYLTGFGGTKDSVVIATRLPADPRKVLPNTAFPGSLGVITEPETKLSIMAAEWIDPSTLAANVMVVWQYGVGKGNGNNGQRLVKQATP